MYSTGEQPPQAMTQRSSEGALAASTGPDERERGGVRGADEGRERGELTCPAVDEGRARGKVP
jgi:hypothetical protein